MNTNGTAGRPRHAAPPEAARPGASPSAWRRLWGVFALLLLLITGIALWRMLPATPPHENAVNRASLSAPLPVAGQQNRTAAIDDAQAGHMIIPAGFMRAPSGALLPRFATLRQPNTPVRLGPGPHYPVAWIIRTAGMPLEVLAEAGSWLRVRDHEGEEGWLPASALGPQRSALVAPWQRGDKLPLHAAPRSDAPLRARIIAGAAVELLRCDGRWCLVRAGDVRGWLAQPHLWGIYRHERIPAGG